MSSTTQPISPSRFAAALQDLPLSTLHLKAAELRNSIAHLDYSNEQLKEFASDPDCVEAITENESVIERMEERIRLLKAEVERRGMRWGDWDADVTKGLEGEEEGVQQRLVNGHGNGNGRVGDEGLGEDEADSQRGERGHEAWRDGTFQTGRITGDGDVVMHGVAGGGEVNRIRRDGVAAGQGQRQGGRLTDEGLRRAMEERIREDDDDDGMHL